MEPGDVHLQERPCVQVGAPRGRSQSVFVQRWEQRPQQNQPPQPTERFRVSQPASQQHPGVLESLLAAPLSPRAPAPHTPVPGQDSHVAPGTVPSWPRHYSEPQQQCLPRLFVPRDSDRLLQCTVHLPALNVTLSLTV